MRLKQTLVFGLTALFLYHVLQFSEVYANDTVKNGMEKIDRLRGKLELSKEDPLVYIRYADGTGCLSALDGEISLHCRQDPLQGVYGFLEEYRYILNIDNPVEEFILRDQIVKGDRIHFRFDQYWLGVPIWGAQLSVHLKHDGTLYFLNGHYYPSPHIGVLPTLTEQEGFEKATEDYVNNGGSPVISRTAKLMIFTTDGKDFRLTWHVIIQGENILDGWEYFIGANTGDVLYALTTIRTDGAVVGSGRDSQGITRSLNMYEEDAVYYLADATREMYSPPFADFNGVIATYDFEHSEVTANLIETASLNISDPAAVDVHYHFGEIYEFYRDLCGRDSWDDDGTCLRMGIHYGEAYNNAAWTGASNNLFIFGDGDGERFDTLTAAFDVCCHEYQHAVTEATAGLIYHNQPGALNEAYSDIAASVYDPNWLIGELCYTPGIEGDALRYMDDPESADLPAHMNDYVYMLDTRLTDWGGVHINMSIPCLAFVNMVDGRPHFTREEAFTVWYHALVTYLNSESEFLDAREAVLQAAEDAYGSSADWDSIQCGIKDAFASVGLGTYCSGGEDDMWTGEYIYYWDDEAVEYPSIRMPTVLPGIEGYGVRFTIPEGEYEVSGVYFFIYSVSLILRPDMVIGLYEYDGDSYNQLVGDTISYGVLSQAAYEDSMEIPLVGIEWGEEYEGDLYAFVWLMYSGNVYLAVDNGMGSDEERNYYLDGDGYVHPLSENYGGVEHNIVSFASVRRFVGVDDTEYIIPHGLSLDLHVYPTPFNTEVELSYSIPGEGELVIRNMLGREVRHYSHLAGEGTLRWNATDDNGRPLPTGMYMVSARSELFPMPLTRKVLYLK